MNNIFNRLTKILSSLLDFICPLQPKPCCYVIGYLLIVVDPSE
jgi:hypothetical protein